MKKLFLIISAIVIFTGLESCLKDFNEFGEDSVFYYLNDEPVVPMCSIGMRHNSLEITVSNDTLHVHICGNVKIDYTITNFKGKGLYQITGTNGNTCTANVDITTFHATDNRKTFLRVLEIDTLHDHFSGIFEADLVDENNHHMRITKGRMDVKFLYPDY